MASPRGRGEVFEFIKIKPLILSCFFLTACNYINFFKGSNGQSQQASSSSIPTVLGRSLGVRAGVADEAALEALYSISSELPPAPIRPDPDLYARRLLLQYREEGSTVARQIGSIEGFRLLLGGASEDFLKSPQTDYDASSLLANLTVAEHICRGLVAPNPQQHGGWESILPAEPADWESNIRFLAQRIIGKPSSQIQDDIISPLKALLDVQNASGNYTYDDYIAVCTTLAMDAEALLL